MSAKKGERKYLNVRVDAKLYDQVAKIAISEKKTRSDITRRLIDSGMKFEHYRMEDDALYQMVRRAVQEVIKGPVERLAAIGAKAGQMSGAAFFFNYYVMQYLTEEEDGGSLEEAAAKARKLGIDFLKLPKDGDMDTFIAAGLKTIND